MENIEDYIRKSKLAKKVQNIWSSTNNIIGYSLIATVIILGVQNGYRATTHFAVFCWAAGFYFFSKYISNGTARLQNKAMPMLLKN